MTQDCWQLGRHQTAPQEKRFRHVHKSRALLVFTEILKIYVTEFMEHIKTFSEHSILMKMFNFPIKQAGVPLSTM